MSEKEKGGSKTLSLANDGAVAGFYTQTNFCKVYPVLGIYKFKWSFSKRGAKGAGFDIYMEIPVVIDLIKRIQSGQIFKQIEADRNDASKKYPEAWKHAMGPEAGNVIAFGPASRGNGIVLQGQAKLKKQNVFIPVEAGDLMDMADTISDVLNLYGEGEDTKAPVYGWRKDRARRILKAMDAYRHDENVEPDTPAPEERPVYDKPAESESAQLTENPATDPVKPAETPKADAPKSLIPPETTEKREEPVKAETAPAKIANAPANAPTLAVPEDLVSRAKVTTSTKVLERQSHPGAYAFQGTLEGDGAKHNFVITAECAKNHEGFIKAIMGANPGQTFPAEYHPGRENNTVVLYIDKMAVRG